MADAHGFLTVPKKEQRKRAVEERVNDWRGVYLPIFPIDRDKEVSEQARRCMDCGIPFCHSEGAGCPLGNLIPEWNDLVRRGDWELAISRLHATNNFPEFTGKICPAPCEAACVLSIDPAKTGGSVVIKRIEETIIEHAWESGFVSPQMASQNTGRKVAVVGSGPAGLAAAQQLTRAGHDVTVYEKDDRLGGLLRYGIPEYKLEKDIIDRRILQMHAEGTHFVCNTEVGVDITVEQLHAQFDAVVLAIGAMEGRDNPIVEGRKLKGIHLAMEHLVDSNRECSGDGPATITAEGKHVLIIGGGDTGADCLGTAHRQKAASVTQLDYNPRPPELPDALVSPWPTWPLILRGSTAHDEGGDRHFEVSVQRFIGDKKGNVKSAVLAPVKVERKDGKRTIIPCGEEFSIPCELVLFAIGFEGVVTQGLVESLQLELTPQRTIKADESWQTSTPGVFVCGDAHKGASLVVWAIAEGRAAATAVDEYLMGSSQLPSPVTVDSMPIRA